MLRVLVDLGGLGSLGLVGADLRDQQVGVNAQLLNLRWSLSGDKLWDINNLERNYCCHEKTLIFVFSL